MVNTRVYGVVRHRLYLRLKKNGGHTMTKNEEKLLSMIESISEGMVKMQEVIGDVVHSNVAMREDIKELGKHNILLEGRVHELEKRDGIEG
jgi:hypothetical protein